MNRYSLGGVGVERARTTQGFKTQRVFLLESFIEQKMLQVSGRRTLIIHIPKSGPK